ncbi:MAG: SDR family oxidoreductase [Sphingobacteriales bacterium]|nr:MAG: SDR family oxidoreductase [Sphingobacteriales bacterium]
MASYLIIGASSGIGQALAAQLTEAGHTVYGTYHSGTITNTAVQAQSFNVLQDDWQSLTLPETLDGLAYCPGTIDLKPFGRFTDADFTADYQLQVLGAIQAVRRALPQLRKSANASVLFFSSVAARKGYAFHSLVSTHKAALEGFSKALAAELAPKIRVNCIAPSLTQTPLAGTLLDSDEKLQKLSALNPMKRVGQPEDIATLAAYLLSPQASWITGQVIAADGGASTL